jgi:hypothetical protein
MMRLPDTVFTFLHYAGFPNYKAGDNKDEHWFVVTIQVRKNPDRLTWRSVTWVCSVY